MSHDQESDDFFSDQPRAAAPSAAPPREGDQVLEDAKVTWRSRVKPVHVFGVMGVLCVAWAFAPSFSSSQQAKASSGDPAAARYGDYLGSEPPAAGAPASASAGGQATSSVASTSPPVAVGADAPASDQLEPLRAQISSLTAELDAMRSAAPVCPPVPAPLVAKPPKPAAPARRAVSDDSSRQVLAGYRLNTIYGGQAWIERDSRTYVVEPGTSIGTVRIERIDARSRTVSTSQGDIR